MAVLSPLATYDIEAYGLTPKLPDPLDSTMLNAYMRCPSKFYYAYVLGLTPKSLASRSPALYWGTMWHSAHERYNAGESLDAVLAWITENWPHDVLTDMDEKGRTLGRMYTLFAKYIEQFGELDQREWTTVRQEQFFSAECDANSLDCPYGGCGLRWCGRIDRIARNSAGHLYVWDYKTTSYLRRDFFEQQEHGFQLRGYAWLARHITDQPVRGVFVDMLHTTKLTEEFHRRQLRMQDAKVVEWINNVRPVIEEIRATYAAHSHEPWAWRKNWNACSDFSGCIFRDIDYEADVRDTRLRVMQNYYEEQRWNPSDPTAND